MRRWCATIVMSAAGAAALAAPAGAQDEDRFALTPYLWLPNIEGELRFDPPPGAEGSPQFEIGPVDWLENLEFGISLAGEARFGRYSALADVIYVDFGRQDGAARSVSGPGGAVEIPVDAGTQIDLSGWAWSLAGGATLVDGERGSLQALAGVRYLGAESSVDWRLDGPLDLLPQAGSASRDIEAWDGLVGVRGEGRAGAWIFPYYLDVGAGESELTWQAIAGVGYRFGWGDLRFNYRHLHYEQDEDEAIEKLDLSGPALSATFRF
jgi:hypothetical protein